MYDLTAMRVEIDEYIALVTFDKPPVNAQNFVFQEEVKACFDQLSIDDAVRVVVLTGAGRVFSAGTDLNRTTPVSRDDRLRPHSSLGYRPPAPETIKMPAWPRGSAALRLPPRLASEMRIS